MPPADHIERLTELAFADDLPGIQRELRAMPRDEALYCAVWLGEWLDSTDTGALLNLLRESTP